MYTKLWLAAEADRAQIISGHLGQSKFGHLGAEAALKSINEEMLLIEEQLKEKFPEEYGKILSLLLHFQVYIPIKKKFVNLTLSVNVTKK